MSESAQQEYPPLSALNDLLFCARRCALHRIEGVWVENRHTLSGTHHHRKVHAEPSEEEVQGQGKLVRGMWVYSDRLRLVGVADLVEFHPDPFPIEYKRGKRRRWDNDDVQLCAQALCLEEMLDVTIEAGAVFHVGSRRRREVRFDAKLRQNTEDAVVRLHELLASRQTPAPEVHPKCKECSLYSTCMPELIDDEARYRACADSLFRIDTP